jgi:hypothetical protein
MCLLHYDAGSGIFTWKRPRPKIVVGQVAGTIVKSGHRRIEIDAVSYGAHRLAWLFYYGKWPRIDLDHVNGKPDDNRIDNLRLATRSQNVMNGKLRSDNTSGFKGVHWNKLENRWKAQIRKKGTPPVIRSFIEKQEAIDFYKTTAVELYGSFARFS